MLEAESILKDEGDSEILKTAMENGSSVVCVSCGDLIAKERWEAHRDHWCSKIEEKEGDSD